MFPLGSLIKICSAVGPLIPVIDQYGTFSLLLAVALGEWDRAARFLVEEICQGDPDRAKRLFNALRRKLEPKKKSAE
jgi:hypothetical protein